jgi:1-phosphatidylinositol-3-phosphate 5-kinase
MTSQISNQSESPTHSSPVLPVDDSRRTSIISEASHTVASQDSVAKTLDKIHTAASRTDTLTTFDFGSPPRPPSSGDIKGLAGDIVQGGFSGLYSRIKATVGGGRDVVPIHGFSESGEDASGTSGKQRPTLSKTGMISPTNMSTPSSRLQSPSTSTFAEHNITQPSPSSLHSQRPSITEQTLVVDIPGVQQPSHSTKSPTPATPIGKEVRRQPTRTQSSGTKAPFTDHPDVDPDRILDSQKIGYNDHTLLTDSDRTPRPLARLMAPDNHRSLVASSVSPARRKLKERNDVDQVTSFKFPTEPLPLRSNLIQVSQSHLPGFQVSRETSVDGDYSSITSGPKTNRPVPSESGEDLNSKASLTNIDPNDPAARLRNKVLAKELWMRDETAKECFYCGEPFSTFRRKHHCSKIPFGHY